MRSSLKAVALGLAVALLCVPAAFAKGPGGHGGGKPSWAGGSSAGTHEHGKPSWAGQGKGHADKAKTKHAKHQKAESDADAADEASGDGELNLDDFNPAWFCKMTWQIMEDGPGNFADLYGTNDNKANAFGMCVSERAQDQGSGEADEGSADDEANCDSADEEGSDDSADGGDETSGDDTSGDDTSSDEGAADEDSGDEVDASDECQQDDGSAEDPSADEGDSADGDQSEESDTQGDEDDQADEAAFARALLRYVHL
jgi:hypothetical protein